MTEAIESPRKRGRKPIGEEAMTPAQRQQRYRIERARAANSGMKPEAFTDTALLDRIRTCLSDGSARRTVARYVDELARRHGTPRP